MSLNKKTTGFGLVFLSILITLIMSGNVLAWGEDSPHGSAQAWLMDIAYCDPTFTVAIANFNHSYPNAFNYTLTYTLQYRDTNNIIQDESIAINTYNITLPNTQYMYQFHNIDVNTIMNILEEVEEDTDDPYRVVKVELEYEYCDNGGCLEGGADYHLFDFTNCDPVSGTSYGEPLSDATTIDYGFDLDGKGSDGGSGSIYEDIDLYGGTGDESKMGAGFYMIFFALIPIIFVFAVLKMCQRLLK